MFRDEAGWQENSSCYSEQHTTKTSIIFGIFHLIFLHHGLPEVSETIKSKITDQGHYCTISILPISKPRLIEDMFLAQVQTVHKENGQDLNFTILTSELTLLPIIFTVFLET